MLRRIFCRFPFGYIQARSKTKPSLLPAWETTPSIRSLSAINIIKFIKQLIFHNYTLENQFENMFRPLSLATNVIINNMGQDERKANTPPVTVNDALIKTVTEIDKSIRRLFSIPNYAGSLLLVDHNLKTHFLMVLTSADPKALKTSYMDDLPEGITPQALIINEQQLLPEIDPEIAQLIRNSQVHYRFGLVGGAVDLTNPEFRQLVQQLSEWYQDTNLGQIRQVLERISEQDYQCWQQAERLPYDPILGTTNLVQRAFNYWNNWSNSRAGIAKIPAKYAQIKKAVLENLVGPQGHPADTQIFEMGEGNLELFPPSPVHRQAVETLTALNRY